MSLETHLSDYEIISTLYVGKFYTVHRAFHKASEAYAILKVTSSDHPSKSEIDRLHTEFSLINQFDSTHIIKVRDLFNEGSVWVLVLEDVQGLSLRDMLKKKILSLEDFFPIAISIVQGLSILHKKNILHRDIKPSNIIISPLKEVKIIDFSIAGAIKEGVAHQSHQIEGTLEYLSPEQTGRINQMIGISSDMYSLGITFYEMLSGRVPFKGKDPLDIIYAHLAKKAEPLSSINPGVPLGLSKIIEKLIEKDPENRYQTADGLLYDLKKAESLLKKTGNIESFNLGKFDGSIKLHLSSKIYGREKEIHFLESLIDTIQEKTPPIVMVKGFSGVGKSSLIENLLPYIEHKKGELIKGKFDQLKRNVPYYALIEGLKKYFRVLFSKDSSYIENTKEKIELGLGNYARLITDLVPEVSWVLNSEPPPLPKIAIHEETIRFESTLLAFLEALTSLGHPLVFFFDDLQWADTASLGWIEQMVPRLKNTLFIGAYRSNEITTTHPLKRVIKDLIEKNIPITEISLEPLSIENTKEYLTDSLKKTPTENFNKIFYQKTGGNPFFIKQLLEHLDKIFLLEFNGEENCWIPKTEEVKEIVISGDVVDLMTIKINDLDGYAREIVSLASILGIEGSLSYLADLFKIEEPDLIKLLQPATKIGLIRIEEVESGDKMFHFAHDKIQQAAYSLIPIEKRKEIHLKIARSEAFISVKEKTFHFNQGKIEELSQEELSFLVKSNMEQGRLAILSCAYEAALESFIYAKKTAHIFLTWEKDFSTLFEIYEQLAKAYFYNLNLEEAEEVFTLLFSKSQSLPLLQARIHRLKVDLYKTQGRLNESLEEALKGLSLLGIHFQRPVEDFTILRKILKVRLMVVFVNLETLGFIQDPQALEISQLFSSVFSVVSQLDPKLFILMCAECTRIHLIYGYTEHLFGFFLSTFLFFIIHDFKNAKIFYDYIYKVNQEIGGAEDLGAILFLSGGYVDHWFYPFSKNIESTKRAIFICYEKGLHFYGTSAKLFYTFLLYRTSASLEKVQKLTLDVIEELKKEKHYLFLEMVTVLNEGYKYLRSDPSYNEGLLKNSYQVLIESKSQAMINGVAITLSMFFYLTESFSLAEKYSDIAFNSRMPVNNIVTADQELFCFLSFAKQKKYSKKMKTIEKTLKFWANLNPENYLGSYYIALGVKFFITSKFYKSVSYFDQALAFFEKKGWHSYIAITEELVAETYQAMGLTGIAKFYLSEAVYHYDVWGARAKSSLVKERLPKRNIDFISSTHGESSVTITSESHTSSMIDLISVIKVSQAISEEIFIDKLLARMMELILENSGAQRGIILNKKTTYYIRVEGKLEEGKVFSQVFSPEECSIEEFQKAPLHVIQFTDKSREPLLITKDSDLYLSDPYFGKFQPKAAISMPILHKAELVGILYLEHFSSAHAFNPDIIQVLNLIVHQAAISMENAELYSTYRRFVPYEFLKHLHRRNLTEIRLGDKVEQVMTVLFADIRGFTSISENLAPSQVFDLINLFLGKTSPIIRKHGGFVDKYIGDAIMGIFPGDPDSALDAAIEIQNSLVELNASLALESRGKIHLGIGINTGNLVLGVIGESERLEGSVFGDTVNIASRIESLNKIYETRILVTGETKNKLKDSLKYSFERIDIVNVRGKKLPVEIWKVLY